MSSVLRRTHFLYQNVLRLRIQVLFVRNDRLIYIKGNGESLSTFSVVPHNEIFSNRFLEDLEKIWELRYYIPDPNKLEYANCECAPCSRYKGEIIQGW